MTDIEQQAHQQMEWGYFLLEHAPKSRLPFMLAALDAKAGDEITIVGSAAHYRGAVLPVEDRDIAYLADTSAGRRVAGQTTVYTISTMQDAHFLQILAIIGADD
jgi:hypothetical protein